MFIVANSNFRFYLHFPLGILLTKYKRLKFTIMVNIRKELGLFGYNLNSKRQLFGMAFGM